MSLLSFIKKKLVFLFITIRQNQAKGEITRKTTYPPLSNKCELFPLACKLSILFVERALWWILLSLKHLKFYTFFFQRTNMRHWKWAKRKKTFSMCEQKSVRTQSPTTKSYDIELLPFGVIIIVRQSEVRWKGINLGVNSVICYQGINSVINMTEKSKLSFLRTQWPFYWPCQLFYF